jgi:olefin beta-lactone synthetase
VSAAKAVNVAANLASMAVVSPDRPALIVAATQESRTFRQLHEESNRLAHGLAAIGIRRGLRTVLMVPPSLEFFTLTFALFKIGAVPILIDPGMGIRNLGRCLAESEPAAFIGVPKAHLARKLLGWGRSSIRITVTTGRWLAQHALARLPHKEAPYATAETSAGETAAIVFTSGSTGVAKGVVYTHGIFAAQIDLLRSTYGIKPGEIDLSTFPLFALFGPALGMTAIVPDMDPTRPANVDPRNIITAVEKHGVTNLFGSPALINRVGGFTADNGVKLSSLQRVISAGAPVPAKVIERFTLALRPGVELHTPYGATEALPVASIGSDFLLSATRQATEQGCGVCVGRPVESMRVRIIPISDEPLRHWDDSARLGPGEIGEIAVSGPVVTASYFNRPQATELAKMRDETGAIWHRMGDLGYLDSEGRLWFCGRKSQRVVTSRGTLFTIPCEAIFNAQPGVYRSALVGVPANGQVHPVMCIEPERSAPWRDRQRAFLDLAGRHAHTRSITQFLFHPSFPVDVRHNAKIFREKLAIWAARRLKHHRWPVTTEPIAPPPTFDSLLQSARSEHS